MPELSSTPRDRPRFDRSALSDLLLSVVCIVALAAVMSNVFAASSPVDDRRVGERIGEVVKRHNDVRRRTAGVLVWDDVRTGQRVYAGDAVYVGADSEALITLDDGTRIEIDERSLVLIKRPARWQNTAAARLAINVVRGSASGQAGSDEVRIRAAGTSMRMRRGSKLSVRIGNDQRVRVQVSKGRTEVTTKTGSRIALVAGQRGTVSATGDHPPRVQTLSIDLVEPRPGRRILFVKRSQVRFTWKPVDGTGPYKFELSSDPGFADIVARVDSAATSVTQSRLAHGIYYWRVRRDGATTPQLSEERKLVLLRNDAPVVYQPRATETIIRSKTPTIVFAWARVANVARYRIELAQKGSFARPAVRSTVSRASYRYDGSLAEAHYCVRVRAADADRPNSPWSRSRCFELLLRPRLAAPEVEGVKVEFGDKEQR